MNKDTYIKILQYELDLIRHPDKYEIINDYSSFFDEGLASGKTESEIARELGDPKEVVRQLNMQNENRNRQYYRSQPQYEQYPPYPPQGGSGSSTVGNILKFIGIAFLLLTVGFPLVITVAALLFAFFISGFAISIGGLYVMLTGNMSNSYINGVHYAFRLSLPSQIFGSLAMIAFGLLLLMLAYQFSKLVFRGIKSLMSNI